MKRKSKIKRGNPDKKRKKITTIIRSLSHGWLGEERETSILYDHYDKVVHLETSYPPTARRWFDNLWGDPNVIWDMHSASLKITVPWDYCRKPDLVLKVKHRKFKG